jgi:hypothetical protein
MKVLPTQNGDAAAARTADIRMDSADPSAFKAVLAQASTDETTAPEGVKLRKGEEIKAVEGHAYSEVTKGAREGMYVNTSGNVRNGQAFVLVRKNGKEYHIYGTGKDRLVVGFHVPTADKAKDDLSDIKLRKDEKLKPVEGHQYAEIVSGPRSGMYVNTSDNERRGEAFVLTHRQRVEYHIYGSGDDRQVIAVRPSDDDK